MARAVALLLACRTVHATIEPRYQRDSRCPAAIKYDAAGSTRLLSGSRYKDVSGIASVEACGYACCGDWSCLAFVYNATSHNCGFNDDVDAVTAASAGLSSGVRGHLPSRDPPGEPSSWTASLDPEIIIGINGDEFPITWGRDGRQYTGAGDNHQPGEPESPLAFFSVDGQPEDLNCTLEPTHHNQPSPSCQHIQRAGAAVPINGSKARKLCPTWENKPIPNLKSSGVISVDGALYWAISCFDYGDDPIFNRQRYGPAWIVASRDGGATWDEDAMNGTFAGNLAAPRFLQFGRDNAGAIDNFVYVYFPGTTSGAAFFENNDQVLLGRVPANAVLDVGAYAYFMGTSHGGEPRWTSDATLAAPVFSNPLMTSVQQVNAFGGASFVFASWAWISVDGYPRPDHTPDERNGRTGHQRTQLTLFEGDAPWGPFRPFFRADDWVMSDGSAGAYTPVIPPAWVADDHFSLVSTQCCGNPRLPLNNYNFLVQRVNVAK